MKILVVDDHSLITDALSVLFLDLDPEAEVITTRTAESALQLQQEHPDLDLVVLDLGLPGVSGTSLLEAMVAQAPEMKILVLSGQQDQRNVMRVLQLGAAGFVPKSMASQPGRADRAPGTGTAAAGTRRTDQDHLPRTRPVRRHGQDPRHSHLPRLRRLQPDRSPAGRAPARLRHRLSPDAVDLQAGGRSAVDPTTP